MEVSVHGDFTDPLENVQKPPPIIKICILNKTYYIIIFFFIRNNKKGTRYCYYIKPYVPCSFFFIVIIVFDWRERAKQMKKT